MGNNILKGKKGIIFGALDDSSIAWKTAEKIHEEGGEFILTNAPVSIRMGTINELGKKLIQKLFLQMQLRLMILKT